MCIRAGQGGGVCGLYQPPVFPPAGLGGCVGGVSWCKQSLAQTYHERAGEKSHLQPRSAAGTSGVSARAAGDRATLRRAPGTSPEAEESPTPKLAFPTSFFFLPLTPWGFGLGEMSATAKGWSPCPERRAATAARAGEGTVPIPHPAPFVPPARGSPRRFAQSQGVGESPPAQGFASPGAGRTPTHRLAPAGSPDVGVMCTVASVQRHAHGAAELHPGEQEGLEVL